MRTSCYKGGSTNKERLSNATLLPTAAAAAWSQQQNYIRRPLQCCQHALSELSRALPSIDVIAFTLLSLKFHFCISPLQITKLGMDRA